MTDRDLDRLKTLPVPPARPEARARALGAAMAAFEKDRAGSEAPTPGDAAAGVEEIRTAAAPQGSAAPLRLTDASIRRRSSWMRRPETMAMAAAVALVAVGVPMLAGLIGPAEQNGPLSLAKREESKGGSHAVHGAIDRSGSGGEPRRVAVLPVPPSAQPPAPPAAAPPPQRTQSTVPGMAVAPRAEPSQDGAAAAAQRAADASRQLAEARERQSQMAGIAQHDGRAIEAHKRREVAGGGRATSHDLSPDSAVAAMRRLPGEQSSHVQTSPRRDRFATAETNPVKSVATEPVSTFSIDVDTASYSLVRRALVSGRLPPREAVRVEEMINYFPYAWAPPETADPPFRPTVTVLPSPWNPARKLVHIALKGYGLKSAERPRANLVLLVDVSGSMAPADRLPLLKNAFRMLVDELRPDDTVAIVTYAAGSDIRLQPTKVADRIAIVQAIDSLGAAGSTHGAAGIQDAYRVAEASFDKAAVNRVILATDGDWNVGITDRGQLKGFIEGKRRTGIYLSILGVGMGNHNDALMQTLAQNGNGIAAYIDTLSEARKVLVEEASSTLFPIARDVKIQVEFNPARVAAYRLIGYETRALRREDFANDKVDAGDIGSGHSVTAIYEITPVAAQVVAEGLRYGKEAAVAPSALAPATDAEFAFLKLRYKLPSEDVSKLIELPVGPALEKGDMAEVSTDVRFSVAVAGFGQLLRGTQHLGSWGLDDVIALANGARGDDPWGYRAELVDLVRLARSARRP